MDWKIRIKSKNSKGNYINGMCNDVKKRYNRGVIWIENWKENIRIKKI